MLSHASNISKESRNQASGKTNAEQEKGLSLPGKGFHADLQSLANNSASVKQLKAYQDMADSHVSKSVQPVIQKAERQTTLFNKTGKTWHKNMQIIDSDSPSDYVHLSRSAGITQSDKESFSDSAIPNDVDYNEGSDKRERVELATSTKPNFKKDSFTAANNVHITLEGRYRRAMHKLSNEFVDDTIGIKKGAPVDGEFNNLNFGDFITQADKKQLSNYSIQQWIENTADDAEYVLRAKTPIERKEDVPELLSKVDEVKNSTLAFTNQLIAGTPALKSMEEKEHLVHYGGTPWKKNRG